MKAMVVLPFSVNPLIKLCRWAFLISGIAYGIVNQKRYSILAVQFREEERKMNILRAEQFAREESLRNQETAREIAEAITGLRVRFEEALGVDTDKKSTDDSTSNEDSTTKNDSIEK
ncbi:ATP synthase subunit e, mitochondrial-like [Belonocnema kinseyi]|uniref:ATP synthase subunit e, mitochondrial-like n=1 Tax=Belonocnema kinseyi TaxID=2817044 RepID=UPI00143D8B80|nr:ATP synthase subunit e, mitochondrial-like [Belonocnema kinseyi]